MIESPLRVMIADDHVAMRTGVRMALEDGGCTVCAEAGSAEDAIAAAQDHRPDVCLVDLHMPGDGIKAVGEIVATVAETSVVVLTVSAASDDLFAALRAGAVGYLLKDMDPTGLPAALRAVAAGEVAISRRLTSRLVDEILRANPVHRVTTDDARSVELTPREWEVLGLLADDLSTGAIAARLGLDQVTVRRHVSGVLRKLGVAHREDAVRLFRNPPASP